MAYSQGVASLRDQASRPEPSRRPGGGDTARIGPAKKGFPVAAVGLIAGAVALGAGLLAVTKAAAGSPAHYLVGADVSGSQTDKERRSYLNVLDSMISGGMAPGSRLTVWSFDRKVGKLYTGEPRKTSDVFGLEDALIGYKSTTRGTTPSIVLPEMIAEAEKSAEPVVMLLFWDAEDDDPAATTALAEKIAAAPGIKALWVLGLPPMQEDPTARTRVEKEFASLGDKLVVSTGFDLKEGMETLRSRLK